MGWLSGWGKRKSITLSRSSGAVTNYQMELAVGESSGSITQISGCENTTNWSASNASLSNVTGIEGTNCLKIAGSGADAFASYAVPSGERDWSKSPIISFLQKRDGNTQTSGQVFIFSGSAYQHYGFTMADDWTEIVIDKENPAGSSGIVNWSNITAIRFDANYSGTNLYIDNVRRSPRVHCEGSCLSSFDDLRFTTSDGSTLLDFWIESLSGTTPNQIATIWIEFNSIDATSTTFYMYYEEASASPASNGANTFIFFDDFERGSNGDAVGGSWTVTLGSCTISTDHAFGSGTRCCKLAGHASYSSMYATLTDTPDSNIALRFKEWKETAVVNGINMYLNGPVGSKTTNMYVDASEALRGPGGVSLGITVSADAWHYLEQKNFDWLSSYTYDVDYNGSAAKTGAAMGATVSESNTKRLGFMCADTTVGRDVYIDNIFVRNWRSTGPAWGAWGTEEINTEFLADTSETATFTDEMDGVNAVVYGDTAETVTLTDVVDGYGPWSDGASETATLADEMTADVLKESTSETATITDEMAGQSMTDGITETATITDLMERTYETESNTAEAAIFSDLMECLHLVDGINETITFLEYGTGAPQNPHRRKQMLWNIQNKHISLKFEHNQSGRGVHLVDCAIRCGRIRREDSTRFVHMGQHIKLKFQHNVAGEAFSVGTLSMQVNRIDNPSAAPRDVQSVRFAHQGSHMQLKFRHNEAGKTILLKSLAMTCNRTNNPP